MFTNNASDAFKRDMVLPVVEWGYPLRKLAERSGGST